MLDFLAFPDHARVWIYQSDKPIPEQDVSKVNTEVGVFARQWVSHNRQLKATGGLLHDRFVVLVADESRAGASGCSIDASVRFVKSLEPRYGVDLFNRMQFAYIDDDGDVRAIAASELGSALASGKITGQTLFFDNLVNTKGDFIDRWLVPLEESWMQRFV